MENKWDHRLNHSVRLKHPREIGKDGKLLLITSTLFTVAITLSNTFVNVYLWRIEKNYILIGWFNFYQYITMMITFVFAGKLAKTMDRVFILRIGVIILTIFYLVVFLLGASSAKYNNLLGIILGTGQGFYWFAYNILYFEITEPKNRDIFNGWNGLLTSIGGIIAPFTAGWFISHHSGLTGYRKIFFTSLIIFLFAVLISFLFYKRKSPGYYRLNEVIKESMKNSKWRNIILGMIAQGAREGLIIFIIGLLIYIKTNNEFSLGSYEMIISAVSSVTYFSVGKFMKKEWRDRSMLLGTMMMAIVVIPMFLKINYSTLLMYGIGTSIFAPLYFIPLTSKIFDAIGENDITASLRDEYVVMREIGLNLGRVMMLLLFIYFVKALGIEWLKYLLLLAGSMQIFTWYFMKSVHTDHS